MLPTVEEVLRVYFYRHKNENMAQSEAVEAVINELCDIWNRARIPTGEQRAIVSQFDKWITKYRNISRNKGRGGSAQLAREADFQGAITRLFDIAHKNALNLITIEEDKIFLMDQRTERKYCMGGVDKALAKKEDKQTARRQKETERLEKEEKRKRDLALWAGNPELSDSSESCNETDPPDDYYEPSTFVRV